MNSRGRIALRTWGFMALLILVVGIIAAVTQPKEPRGMDDLIQGHSEARADGGSVSRLKDGGHLCTIVDNRRNGRNAASVCSNLNGRAVTVRDKNGVAPGSGRARVGWKAKAHVGMEWKDAQGGYHGSGPVSDHR